MDINRRTFIKSAGLLAVGPMVPFSYTLANTEFNSDGGYKALICVFLAGGNDSFNMVLPAGGQHYDDYVTARPDIAHPLQDMLDTGLISDNNVAIGLHPNMSQIAQMMKDGNATALINVGTLREPTTSANYSNVSKPPSLGSHSTQQFSWQRSWETSAYHSHGWAGMMMDLLETPNLAISESMSMSNNHWLGGHSSIDLPLSEDGIRALVATGHSGTVNNNLRKLVADPYGSAFSIEYMSRLENIIDFQDNLDSVLDLYPVDETISTDSLGKQLAMVKRTMQAAIDLGHQRQIFYVSLGGFDNHSNELSSHQKTMQILDDALGSFYASLARDGLEDKTVSFTMSDFGRTIENNSKKGTDHGWGSNQLVLGSAINGGKAYGNFPEFKSGGVDAIGNKFIPSQAHEQMAATLGRWFGLSETSVDYIYPILHPSNENAFSSRYLPFLGSISSVPVTQIIPVAVHASVQKEENPAELAIDGNSDTRWSGKGRGILFTLTLGSTYTLETIKLSISKGDVRQYFMTLQTSSDGVNYSDYSDIVTDGTNANLVEYPLLVSGVSHVRIVCNGNNDPINTSLTAWNNFKEIEIWGS